MVDKSGILNTDKDNMIIQSKVDCNHNLNMTGHIVDRIYKNGELIDIIEGHNLVVDSFLKLIMSLCKEESGYSGIQYWAIGSGETSWDDNIPNPEINATRLTSELGRVQIDKSEISFVTADGDKSDTPTNILQIKHIFGADDCNGLWREFGIFGGNATEEANSGIMINKRHHKLLTKTNEMSIERTMTFTLNLS